MVHRIKLQFMSGAEHCVGYLYGPNDETCTRPCVILATGFGGTQDTPSIQAVAQAFVAAGVLAMTFDYRNFGESSGRPRQLFHIIAPRVLFEMMRYKPSDVAHRLAMPVLVCVAEHDREGPVDFARQLVDQAPRGVLKRYPYAHFDFYRPDVRAQVVSDQIAFLRKHLGMNKETQ